MRALEQVAFHFVAPGDPVKPTHPRAFNKPSSAGRKLPRLAGRRVAVLSSLKVGRTRSSFPCAAAAQLIARTDHGSARTIQRFSDGETGVLLQQLAHARIHTRLPQTALARRRQCDIEIASCWFAQRTSINAVVGALIYRSRRAAAGEFLRILDSGGGYFSVRTRC